MEINNKPEDIILEDKDLKALHKARVNRVIEKNQLVKFQYGKEKDLLGDNNEEK